MKPTAHVVSIRGLSYHVRTWGDADARPLFMLHGFQDTSASFQFAAEKLCGDWHVIAPDWRGYGRTEKVASYWIPDYIADLDALMKEFSPDAAAVLVGHSHGGNLATMYAAICPHRVSALVSIEGFGLYSETASQAPGKLLKWVQEVQAPQVVEESTPTAVAKKLLRNNPGLTPERAGFLSEHFLEKVGDTYRPANDPRHKLSYPIVLRDDEWLEYLHRIEAPTLWIAGSESPLLDWMGLGPDKLRERREAIAKLEYRVVEGCGHGIHYERPEELAAIIEEFLAPIVPRALRNASIAGN